MINAVTGFQGEFDNRLYRKCIVIVELVVLSNDRESVSWKEVVSMLIQSLEFTPKVLR